VSAASSTPQAAAKPAKKITTPPKSEPVKTAVPAQTPTAQNAPSLSPSALNDLVRGSIVNILCTTKAAGPLNSISASGVVIDSRGLILTNAHVGQYFLLKDYPIPDFVTCIIRTGSPARPKYTAELLFLPPSWIAANAQKIQVQKPTGNGEHDYAFIRITGTVSGDVSLPSAFPYLPMSTTPPGEGENMLAAGYAAGFLGGITVQKDLYATSAQTKVGELFTFDTDTIDLFSIGASLVAQQGASGGAVANGNGTLMGLIATTSDAPDTGSRDLRAVSIAYIVRDFEKESGVSLENYLNGDVAREARSFSLNTAPRLTQKLIDAIESN
jgi:S1-C subfamily serine protease